MKGVDFDSYIAALKKSSDSLNGINTKDVYRLNSSIEVLEKEEELYNYWLKKNDNQEYINIGKHLKISLDLRRPDYANSFSVYVQLDDNMANDMYGYVFGSNSGINEFVVDIFVPLISSLLGDTMYSHAFGANDMSWDIKMLDEFEERYEAHGEETFNNCKNAIDHLIGYSKNKKFGEAVDKILELYIAEMKDLLSD